MFAVASASLSAQASENLSPQASLGKRIFFDSALSVRKNQSCASCHTPETGFSGPDSEVNAGGAAYPGSRPGTFGKRKPQSAAYASFAPILHWEKQDGERLYRGGNFWDGRASGERLRSPTAEQAQGPFLDPQEHALPDAACVVARVCAADYGREFAAQNPGACDLALPPAIDALCERPRPVSLPREARAKVRQAFDRIALALAAYEDSREVNAFSSKFDAVNAGLAQFTAQEAQGMALFAGNGKCANCHTLEALPGKAASILTDNTFDNLGIPRNPANPWYRQPAANPDGTRWIDAGLGGALQARADMRRDARDNLGKHKVPSLRNVDKRPTPDFVKAYGHNGYFKSLKGIVHFYNTRDKKPACAARFVSEAEALAQGCWPKPEVARNVNRDELGNLGLSEAEEEAIVAFLRTLSDGFQPVQGAR